MNFAIHMSRSGHQGLRFGLYILLVLLFNAAISYLPWRADLTEQKTYSLAPASKATVAQLEEPVTIRVYLSSNLPSHYNILASLLRDLLQTYSGSAKSGMFSYSVNLIHSDDNSDKMRKLKNEAENYGIYPVQLQGSDGNEFKAVAAYIGMAISQGENLEVLSPLQPNDNIQYQITAALQKMSRESSALLSLPKPEKEGEQPLKIYYYFSPIIAQLEGGKYAEFPSNFEKIMKATREQLYGLVDSQVIDPNKLPSGLPAPGELGLPETEISIPGSNGEELQNIYSAIVIGNEGQYKGYSLLQLQPTLQLGPEGLTQSNTVNVINPLQLEGQLAEIVIGSLGIAQNIGYIHDRETASFDPPNPQIPSQGANLHQFSQEARDLYNFQPVKLDEGIGKDVNILLLVDPKQQLSDWDLYQLDQFVMRGGRLLVAMEPYQIMRNPYGYGAQFIPNPNIDGVKSEGEKKQPYTLIDLLSHYGIEYQSSMVFDKKSFVNRGQNPQTGAYQETQVYYIPEIDAQKSSELPFIQNLKKVFFYNSAPLKIPGGADEAKDTKEEAAPNSIVLLQSSPESWTEDMSDGAKDPNNIMPPLADKMSRQNLIMATQGALTSFFQGKEIPEKPKTEKTDEQAKGNETESPNEEQEPTGNLSFASVQNAFVEQSEYGQILVSGTSLIFDRQLLEVSTNKALALNLLDYMAGNMDMANLRSRSGVPNFIDEKVGNAQKNLVKWFNILGLPLMVGILGLLMLIQWRQRQSQLFALFGGKAELDSSTIDKKANKESHS